MGLRLAGVCLRGRGRARPLRLRGGLQCVVRRLGGWKRPDRLDRGAGVVRWPGGHGRRVLQRNEPVADREAEQPSPRRHSRLRRPERQFPRPGALERRAQTGPDLYLDDGHGRPRQPVTDRLGLEPGDARPSAPHPGRGRGPGHAGMARMDGERYGERLVGTDLHVRFVRWLRHSLVQRDRLVRRAGPGHVQALRERGRDRR